MIIVDWTVATTPDSTWIEYGPDDTYGSVAPARDLEGAVAQGLVLGNPAETTVHLRVVAQVGDTQYASADQVITTGALPKDLVPLTVNDNAPDQDWGSFVLSGYADTTKGNSVTYIVNRGGDVVWYIPPKDGMILASRPARGGRGVLYLRADSIFETINSDICTFDLDGEHDTCVSTPGAHHDFVELPDGSFTYAADEPITYEQYNVLSNNLNHRANDGTITTLWSALEDVPIIPTDEWKQAGPTGYDWIHLNGIWHDEDEGVYYISSYRLEEILKVPDTGGRSDWVLGGAFNQFTFNGQEFGPQHAPQHVDGGLLMFDNSSDRNPSRIVSYQLDEANLTATQDLELLSADHTHALVMGDAHLLPNGYIASAYGEAARIILWSPEGEEVWDLGTIPGIISTQVYVYDDLYTMEPN